MNFAELFADKSLKPKQKTEILCNWLVENLDKSVSLIEFAKTSKDPIKASCMEVLEFVTKIQPANSSELWMDFATESLQEKSPRIKWEAAKVIGNIVHLYPSKTDTALINLLANAKHEGTVVRWSVALALSKILLLKTELNTSLLPTVATICNEENKNSIKKIYESAIKKCK